MYFSVLTPAPGHERSAAFERARDGAYGDHQWLWRLFPSEEGTPRDFLFRRDEVHNLPRYHIVSAREPQPPGAAWGVKSRAYAPALTEGERLAFELRACPTVRHGRDQKSKRHDVVMEAKKKLLAQRGLAKWSEWTTPDRPAAYDVAQQAVVAWLARRGRESAGFDLDESACTVSAYQQHGRSEHDRAKGLLFSTVDITGELIVRDPKALQRALVNGIGAAKAFGCGLLLVRRIL